MNDFVLAMIRGLMESNQIERIVVGRMLFARFEEYANSKDIELEKIFGVPLTKNKVLEPHAIWLYPKSGGVLKASFPA